MANSDEVFNMTFFKAHQENRWKFLEPVEPEYDVGLLTRTPVFVASLTVAYVMFVCFIGPFIMRNREPFQLKNLIRFYNLIMVFAAAVLLKRTNDAIDNFTTMFDCKTAFLFDSSPAKIYSMSSFILAVRISEYLDTIFFTLRKKYNQVTFLHVFHHAFVPLYAYWVIRTGPMRFNMFIIIVNSFIHVLMYFYYFLATFQAQRKSPAITMANGQKKETDPGILMLIVDKILMFKKYMTQLQIIQFVGLALYSIWAALQKNHCGVPTLYIWANLLLALCFLSLFLHFYTSAYKRDPKKERQMKRE